ncbi:MAG: hypothetical protein H0X37_02555 [Herpetosiphonaceae bacterium]|nr:hypothetical protein [Herpetosiphonaceae bacterium]
MVGRVEGSRQAAVVAQLELLRVWGMLGLVVLVSLVTGLHVRLFALPLR